MKGRVMELGGEWNALQLDFLKELENIGASNAATSLAQLLGRPVGLRMPSAEFYPLSQVSDRLGGPETLMAGSLVEMHGGLTGAILFLQPLEDAQSLSQALLCASGVENGARAPFPTPLQSSALREAANILCGSYVNAVAELTGLTIGCAAPGFVIDMAGALMNLPAVMYGAAGDMVLMLETVLTDSDRVMNGTFFLLPDMESQRLLMRKMGLA